MNTLFDSTISSDSPQIAEYFNHNFEFVWDNAPKPKLNDLVAEMPSEWKKSLESMLLKKSVLFVAKEKGEDFAKIKRKDSEEILLYPLKSLEADYNQGINNLNTLAKQDGIDGFEAKSQLFIIHDFDYKDNIQNAQKRDNFASCFLGTASLLGLESQKSNKDFSEQLSVENVENLNFFGREMLLHREKPIDKEKFTIDLKNHAKSEITNDELTILTKMYLLPKPPSLLTAEHKKLIKESLNLAKSCNKCANLDENLKKQIDGITAKSPKLEKFLKSLDSRESALNPNEKDLER